MILKSFSIKNFRSIKATEKINFTNLGILIGPNNEGKTNFLQGLVIFFDYLQLQSRIRNNSFESRRKEVRRYSWEKDFPVSLQESEPNGKTVFEAEFYLNSRENSNLEKMLKGKLNNQLKLTVSFSSRFYIPDIEYFDYHAGKKLKLDFNQKSYIDNFLAKKIFVQYISSIRSIEMIHDAIREMISVEMKKLLIDDKGYKKLMDEIERKEDPIFKRISENIIKTISEFIPSIKKIDIQKHFSYTARSSFSNLIIDDGNETKLEYKGDGFKSLLAIASIHYITTQKNSKKNILLIIEEPESHLHPKAIHSFKDVLIDIARNNQVIISTHSPLLIDRKNLKNNFIVNNSQVEPASSTKSLRDVLGVKIGDNLVNAKLIILVEGEVDKIIIQKWLSEKSELISKLIDDGLLGFDILGGVSNLTYKIYQWNSLLCDILVFIDNDNQGREAFKKTKADNVLNEKNILFANRLDMKESEIEDLIKPNVYFDEINKKYGVDLNTKSFKSKKVKWSGRLKREFFSKSKPYDDSVELEIKKIVAGLVSSNKNTLERKSVCINNLEKSIKDYFKL